MEDAVSKGRQARGERQGHAKLTQAQVEAIRLRYADGEPQRVLAEEFGVRASAISRIVNGKRWKHVK
jgi:transcriptional regulator with XRE-family HTH domain